MSKYLYLGLIWVVATTPATALQIAWYEQHLAGRAGGELRILDVSEGELRVQIPEHPLQISIKRLGSVAVVALTELQAGLAEPAGGPERLQVIATQGEHTARADFALAMADALPAVEEKSAAHTAPHAPIERPADADDMSQLVGAVEELRTSVQSLQAKLAAGTAIPHAGRTQPRADGVAAECPVLAVKPGSLKENVSRLLNECAADLGEWVTYGGHKGVYTDWIVHDPTVLLEANSAGLAGLLDQLEIHYGLKGVRHPRLAHTIDIYKIKEKEVDP